MAVNESSIAISVIELMEKEKFFLRKGLKLEDLSQSIGCQKFRVSRALNNKLGMSFSYLVNSYRVNYLHLLIREGVDQVYTIEGIGRSAGFRCRTTMYRAMGNYADVREIQARLFNNV